MLRMHWGAYKRLKKAVEFQLVAFGESLPESPIDPCKIEIIRNYGYRKRAFDADNLIGSVKILIDGMRDLGIIHNDDPKHMVELDVKQHKSPDKSTFVQIRATLAAV